MSLGFTDTERQVEGNQLVIITYLKSIERMRLGPLLKENLSKLKSAIELLPDVLKGTPIVSISTQSAVSMKEIDNNQIDYIFTDPPYSGTVQYGELNFLWEAWLGFDTHWKQNEIIVSEIAGKNEDYWEDALKSALTECYRVLKPGRWLSLCYHDTSEGTWVFIQDMMAEIGFLSDKLSNTLFIDTSQKTLNQSQAEKVAKRDLVINFRKPYPSEVSGQMTLFDPTDLTNFQDVAHQIIIEALTAQPGTSIDRLYDELVSRTIRQGVFERHNFDALLRSVAEESPTGSGRWYLLSTAGQVDAAETAKEEAAAAWLEAFMQKYLKVNRTENGVHYSDLFEQYLPVADKPRRLMQEWLPEFFFKTADGTWRPAKSDEERQQKAALRSSGALRRIKRFGNALLEGVPPYDKDRPENAATLADWIRQCRRAGLYELGKVLFEKGGLRFDSLSEDDQMEVEEDYQVCARRSE